MIIKPHPLVQEEYALFLGRGACETEVLKRGMGILPMSNVQFPMSCRQESRQDARAARFRKSLPVRPKSFSNRR
jgi:hypothetical protein